jgi:hypothetical protein
MMGARPFSVTMSAQDFCHESVESRPIAFCPLRLFTANKRRRDRMRKTAPHPHFVRGNGRRNELLFLRRKARKEVQRASPFLLFCVPHESFRTFASLRALRFQMPFGCGSAAPVLGVSPPISEITQRRKGAEGGFFCVSPRVATYAYSSFFPVIDSPSKKKAAPPTNASIPRIGSDLAPTAVSGYKSYAHPRTKIPPLTLSALPRMVRSFFTALLEQ